MNRIIFSVLVLALILGFQTTGFTMGSTPQFTSELAAQAETDECFNQIGGEYKPGPNCSSDDIPKSNHSYCWGLTKAGSKLWFGTGSNMLCLVQAFRAYQNGNDAKPFQNSMWTCEYDAGKYLESGEMNVPIPEIFSDYRPPRIYTYDMVTRQFTNVSDSLANTQAGMLLQTTFGLRSAGSIGNLVFLAGPVALGEGINMFVFDATTGGLITAKTMTQYQNIRKWLVMSGVLYTTVADESGGGKILRWTGSPTNPLSFEEVGVIKGSGTEIVEHNGRIFIGTWPSRTADELQMAGLWMSPVVPEGGLTPAHLNAWTQVWKADEFEPDPFNANLYGCGAMASYGGYLYWGTMHVHGKVAMVYTENFDSLSALSLVGTYFNSWRASSVFRGKDFGGSKKVELLYGKSYLPVYVELSPYFGYWVHRPNNMGGVSGKYGDAGFGNPYNNYIWSMAVYKDQLFVGTMDHSYIWLDWENLMRVYFDGVYIPLPKLNFPTLSQDEYGADLWRFPSTSEPAKLVTRDGFGNYANYGFRSTVVDEDHGLFIGTANPMNIFQDSNGNSMSGWELYRVYEE